MKDPMGNAHLGASATAKIARSDFGMNNMQGMVGDEVTITVDVELVDRMGPPRPRPGEAPPPHPGS
jgi:polyisoprenoid-binding protein YceI